MNNPRRKGPRTTGPMASPSGVDSPLDLSGIDDIVAASGLGRRPPEEKSAGEEMSDSDEPTQSVDEQSDGSMVHSRANGAMEIGLGRSNYSAEIPNYFGQG